MTKFNDAFQKILDEAKESSKNKKMKATFSRKMLAQMTEAMLNDPEYNIDIYSSRMDGTHVNTITPVKEFRKKFLGSVLEKLNIEKEDAEKFIETYQFNTQQADSLYDVFTSTVYEFLKAGKNYKLFSHKDCVASLYFKDIPEVEVKDKETGKHKYTAKKHLALGKKSGCPKWLKD